MKISKAENIDANDLTKLTFSSKSYWGYSKEQMEQWKDDLTVTTAYINRNEVYKLTDNNKLIGYYSFYKLDDKKVKLDNIFIAPEFIGKGYGNFLMRDFFDRMQFGGAQKVVLESDPNAEQFYQKLGFKVIGQKQTSIKDRFLPIMEKEMN